MQKLEFPHAAEVEDKIQADKLETYMNRERQMCNLRRHTHSESEMAICFILADITDCHRS